MVFLDALLFDGYFEGSLDLSGNMDSWDICGELVGVFVNFSEEKEGAGVMVSDFGRSGRSGNCDTDELDRLEVSDLDPVTGIGVGTRVIEIEVPAIEEENIWDASDAEEECFGSFVVPGIVGLEVVGVIVNSPLPRLIVDEDD